MSQSQRKPPLEAAYIPQARRVVTAQRLKAAAANDEHEAKLAAARSMNSVQVREFDFEAEGKRYHADLTRPSAERISPVKLYVLVKEGEISVDDFLECVSVNETLATELLGESRVKEVMEIYRKGLDLVITPIK